jgi:hypothetical protein
MMRGYLADMSHNIPAVGIWVEGPPEKGAWGGTDTTFRQRLPVATFRCDSCGFLESYASKDFDAK